MSMPPSSMHAMKPSMTVNALPRAARTSRMQGALGSRVNATSWAGVPTRIAHTRGSSPLSTHQPEGRVTFVMIALTSASWSTVLMPPLPRWSDVTFVTTLTSLYGTPMPRLSNPPRAVSSTATSSPGVARTACAPAGPE